MVNNKNNNNSNTISSPSTGRPASYRWPGLEELSQKMDDLTLEVAAIRLAGSIVPKTRIEELALAKEEAAAREKEYAGGGGDVRNSVGETGATTTQSIEIDFESLRFDTGPDGAHTTIDLGKITEATELATVTTNDFVVFNKVKRVLFDNESGAAASERGWSITDLKLNQTRTALFFVTVQVPVGELKRILNKW